ncbi:MAG: glycosyltransferase family 1 protein, partial [Candidatus Competibacter sp.]
MIAIPSLPFPNIGLHRLRVGIVTETYGPEVNGVAMTVGRLVEGLLARGHSVQLIRPRQHPRDDPRRDGALDVWPVAGAAIPFYREMRIGFPAKRLLLERWRQTPPDVVHIVTEGPLGHSALAVARRLRLRVFSGFHTNFHAYSRHYGMGLLARPIVAYLRRFHNRTDCTLVPTEELATELRSLGFHRLRVLARGVDTRLFDPAHRDPALRRSWGASPTDPVALYVGRLAAEKNLQLVLAAYRALRAIQPTTRLVLVGDGPLAVRLQARHPEIVFPGMRIGADLAAHYASADLFLFPSLTETFGNVTLEAMASGLAVVAFDYAAARRHIVHDQG